MLERSKKTSQDLVIKKKKKAFDKDRQEESTTESKGKN